ncbi:MAG: chemotaxis response regulator protein-glutamate methylesterase [Desulfomonilia bacterium]|nr:chemotaxis response regulator protein-glutamate methylesterase [Desulfomonilia bacterium]
MDKIKVLIIDDSALARKLLKDILDSDHGIEVVGTAPDPVIAMRKISALKPHVLTLDVEMPVMDGLTFLEQLMKAHPMPVVMFSSLTHKGADATLKALSLGAIDFVSKPQCTLSEGIENLRHDLIDKVKTAASANIMKPSAAILPVPPRYDLNTVIQFHPSRKPWAQNQLDYVLVIGASTGGTVAIEQILCALPEQTPPILIVQHMPPLFTQSFAKRLNSLSALNVAEAKDNDVLRKGLALIAPGGKHMMLSRFSRGYCVRVKEGPPVNRHIPSIDVIFRSAANVVGPHAIGVILTGMGDDGARGLKEMHDAGAYTIAQDEETSVVFGMPRVAIALDAVRKVLPIGSIAPFIVNMKNTDQSA